MIKTIDLQFKGINQTIASYLIIGPKGPILVESGPGSTTHNLIAGLTKYGFVPTDVKHVFLTHIHFDHAGAAGWWAQQGAQIYAHHFGAKHLIDPSRLIASATRIYGDEMDTLWGTLLPIPSEKLTSLYDGDTIEAAGLTLHVIETPGHARHHHIYRLGDVAFTGDATAVIIPSANLTDLPAPPPEFDREIWLQTLDRIEAENFSAIYPTHFGRIDNVKEHLDSIRPLLIEASDFVKARMDNKLTRDEIVLAYQKWNKQRAKKAGLTAVQIAQYAAANPQDMSVDGIMRYWYKKETKT